MERFLQIMEIILFVLEREILNRVYKIGTLKSTRNPWRELLGNLEPRQGLFDLFCELGKGGWREGEEECEISNPTQ